ncbi:UDP-N-acetylmuramoyl-L-alanyl-D-glutamate--2,6-diaminopimelate ligase [Kitasatospora viridis]|uniref:UDP-N-acetylmuramoyl-L-alanyl-D-glutamate--2,6-diaminopimelate ligase n=1 Tax=Kitasatospora viridis TaxID=281105 RepID=A0A561T6S2_9ACTN|nr:UDP-N-acetylmuramoyl-L-alanyl-D-glutamate--2,6-diaminopimelate ligase [Kitasatospora viridis]TWF82792.1 UDP-N-acetylmuramoylalanyl-D-glutamate--2,6-diaminopimelate ligase [Kitasatospora viridis]
MKLTDLLDGLDRRTLQGDPDTVDVSAGVVLDSRAVRPGALFAAVAGRTADGHAYLAQAARQGAVAALVERDDVPAPAGLCLVRVADVRRAAARAAARYFGDPGSRLAVIAVTGTNGKTSVAYMLEAVLRSLGQRVGVIGTGGPRLDGRPVPVATSTVTTPQAPELQEILRHLADRGTDTVVLEASSTALLQHRTDDCAIDIGVFTNLTPDHLEDHGSMAAYQDAKMRLFDGQCALAVANADDPVSARIRQLMPHATLTFSTEGNAADFTATDIETTATGSTFTVHHAGRAHPFRLPLPGRFAVANALAATAALGAAGHGLPETAAALAALAPIPGRFETHRTRGGAVVVVDYAHSTDSLEQVLTTIRGFATGRVTTVFGCGGDRDTTKRAPMARVAAEHSDSVVITTDNPRTEDPEAILDQIEAGLTGTPTPHRRIADRRAAIAYALAAAGPEDVVLVAGKGAETYQLVGDRRLPFADMAVVRELDAAGA